jgi:putative MATE family efflux protein
MMGPIKTDLNFSIPEGQETRFIWSESWRLAWPVFIGMGVSQSMILISRMMMGKIGESSLTALGMGQMIFFAIVMGLSSVSVGMVALMAREVGAGNPKEASRIFGQGVYFGTIVSVALALFGMAFSRPIFQLLHTPAEVVEEASRFMRILFIGLPLASASFFVGAGLRAAGDTRTPMIIQVVNTVLNIFIQWVLVFGKFGLPKMGITGAGLAMVLAFAMAMGCFVFLFAFRLNIIAINFSRFRMDWAIFKRLLKIGGPTAIEWELIQFGLIAFIGIVNRYGTEPGAAYIIGITILSFSQLPAMGFNTSATVLVGMCLGAKRPELAEEAVRVNSRASLITMSLIAVLLILFARQVVTLLFPDSSELTVDLTVLYLITVGLAQPFMAISFVQAGALRGAGYSVSPMLVQTFGMYFFRIGLAVLLWKALKAPVQWLWVTQIPDFLFRSIMMGFSIRRGKWKRIKV